MRSRIWLLLALAGVVLAAPSGAGAMTTHTCTIEPYTYDVVADQVFPYGIDYAATATPMLTGATCPLAGRTITVREVNAQRIDPFKSVVGRYAAEWDLDGDGTFDVRWRGVSRGLINMEMLQIDTEMLQLDVRAKSAGRVVPRVDALCCEMLQLDVRAKSAGGATLMLHEEAVLDLLNNLDPLQSLRAGGFVTLALGD
jgi:hypothetical protein